MLEYYLISLNFSKYNFIVILTYIIKFNKVNYRIIILLNTIVYYFIFMQSTRLEYYLFILIFI